MAFLQVLDGEAESQKLRIESDRAILGRHPECDIVLDAAAVSRQHAQILLERGEYYIEDMHSRNGTFVNGRQIQSRQMLQDGDRLKICDLSFTFYKTEPSDRLPDPALFGGGGPASSMLLLDDELLQTHSTVQSKLDVSSDRSGMRLAVNSEVKLRAMLEISHSLGRALSVDEVLPKLLDTLFKIFVQADRGFVILRSSPDGPLIPKAVKHRRPDTEDRARISRTILNQVMGSKEAILSADASSDMRFDTSESIADLRIRSVMCAPLIDGDGNALGVIQIDSVDARQRFQKDDLDLLASVAFQAAVAIDNAQLHEAALKRQEIERDLLLAHKVQRGLLPSEPPSIPGYHFFDFYEPANQVGGDYYDYIDLGDRLAVVLGDVSGKGVSAALLMAKLSGEVRYCLASERTPAGALNRINASFCRSGWDDRFVTFVLAVLDLKTHEVTVVNAGHMPPLVRHAGGQVMTIGSAEAGLPLGVDSDHEYQECSRNLAPGDFVTIFTDGISEAMNSANELYGLERLRAQVGAKTASVEGLGRHILDDVKRFVGGRKQSDDMCLTCFGRAQ